GDDASSGLAAARRPTSPNARGASRASSAGIVSVLRIHHTVCGIDQRLTTLVEQDAGAHAIHRVAEPHAVRDVREPDAAAGADVAEGVLADDDGVLLLLGSVVHAHH